MSSGYLGTARRIVTLRRILKARKPDVLISFLTKNNLIAALATTGVRVSLICSERNNQSVRVPILCGTSWQSFCIVAPTQLYAKHRMCSAAFLRQYRKSWSHGVTAGRRRLSEAEHNLPLL